MKLHLGCGQVYLEGYVNIDFPLSKHSVQTESVADEFADLTKLHYKEKSIEEVRLHHVFEHFPRHQAVALLASWQTWLKKNGAIHIEVPDFEGTSAVALDTSLPDRDQKVAIRHIFGSNEAPWATHYEGWTEAHLREVAELLGFKDITIEKSAYMATRNVTITARNNGKPLSTKNTEKILRTYLKNFTVDDSEFETRLLGIWVNEAMEQFSKTSGR